VQAIEPVRQVRPANLVARCWLGDHCKLTTAAQEESMIRVSILYPNRKDSRFDFPYYVETHMPMSIRLLSTHAGFKGVSVERGLGGATPGSEPTHIAMCHFLFNSVDDFMAAFMPHAEALQGDMPNYTDIEPVIQFNEVLISR
jgi:uncharacterized protein (TIGR02118 family)